MKTKKMKEKMKQERGKRRSRMDRRRGLRGG